jgi:hypothetical protein
MARVHQRQSSDAGVHRQLRGAAGDGGYYSSGNSGKFL